MYDAKGRRGAWILGSVPHWGRFLPTRQSALGWGLIVIFSNRLMGHIKIPKGMCQTNIPWVLGHLSLTLHIFQEHLIHSHAIT